MEELEAKYSGKEEELPPLAPLAFRLEKALESIANHEVLTAREAANWFDVNYHTLLHRLHGTRRLQSEALVSQQKLSDIEEEALCEYITRAVECMFPPSIKMLEEAANLLYRKKCELISWNELLI
ncbi:hypothetical protein GB937_010579 [Aspergillus fischeri]|nr:hypothetical protein GB937_010579 [Aspergillus fischeri]